jgi:hypothetical protein
MNRRNFMAVVGGASVASLACFNSAFAAEPATGTTSLYLKGLVMASFEDGVLRIGFPKAPGHKATLQIVPIKGAIQTIALKGNGVLETKALASGRPKVAAPELVRMSEIYGPDVKSKFAKCPSVIEIPYAAIRSITTSDVTKDRWTFVRADNGQEIDSFRPRQIAEGLKIELSSNSVLKLDGGKTTISLATTQEMTSNYSTDPKDAYPDMIVDHFGHYLEYMDRPPAADFVVVPKRVTGTTSSATPHAGQRFMMVDGTAICFLVALGLDLIGL